MGVLYIIGTVAGVLSVVFTSSILSGSDYLVKVAANANQIIIGALFVLIMGLVLAMVPVFLFPILKKQSLVLAVGYVVFRGALETVTYFATMISWLLLVILSQGYVQAGSAAAPDYSTLGNLLIKGANTGAALTAIVFPLGAIMLYVAFYRSRLIPRWLSVWGLIGVILNLIVTGLLGLFALGTSMPTFQVQDILNLPIFLQEMVMAVWLIAKGFDPTVIASLSARANTN